MGETFESNYRLWLVQELTERSQRNPAYSLRSFAKSLGISAPSLSQILSGKRPLSRKTALKIIEKCSMSPEQASAFLASALGEGGTEALKKTDALYGTSDYQELQIDAFRMISDWYHYAILSLSELPQNQATPKWIASQLGITERQAADAFNRLLKLGIVAKKGAGFYQKSPPLAVPTRGYESAIRKYHRQNLQKAEEMLTNDAPLELFSAITMAIDETQLPKARELIKQFRRRLCRLLESGDKHGVYTLAIQLFPLSKNEKEISQ